MLNICNNILLFQLFFVSLQYGKCKSFEENFYTNKIIVAKHNDEVVGFCRYDFNGELKDRLNQTRAIVSVYDLPDSIAEEIIDYSLKLIEEGEMK